eukprot:TRINITY_DN1417_c0_g1_i2.p3 TRINITY_DN1417_c0_g1~~TRINITY_DN1417_c0_g1_i2.p3  ORF type:complete len:339 (+),score=66.13 TRINITY_DN1417_c0_g1_i2:161-1177(+)
MGVRTLSLFVLALVTCLTPSRARPDKIKGVAFSTGHDTWGYRQWYAHKSLSDLLATGANYVQISVYTKMRSRFALDSEQQTDDESIRYIIRTVKATGAKVFLKPVVEIAGHTWRGFLEGRPIWFRKVYRPFITHMAEIAQQERVDLFAMGSEYRDSEKQVKEWHLTIDAIKRVYTGRLTYIANHDSYRRVHFWHRMDYISISAYFKLMDGVRGASPDMNQTKAMWRSISDDILKWRVWRNFTHKQVLVAEVGAQSKGDGIVYRVPWDWNIAAPVDFYEQEKMYEGICEAFMPHDWIAGIVFWNWELQPHAGTYQPGIAGYTPQNKPALRVMQRYFTST